MKKRLIVLTSVLLVGAVILWLGFEKSSTTNPAIGLITDATEDRVSLITNDGQNISFVNNVHNVSVEHLREHQSGKEPVSVTWYARDDQKIATNIDDAP